MSTPAPDAVKRLVDSFDQNRDAYLSGSYNETQLRREFIDPLFETLGWDVSRAKPS
jgi:predicted type IV restriction endonuclease